MVLRCARASRARELRYNSNYSNNKIIIIIITNNYNNDKSEEDLCTTVSIVLSANSGTFSPVFVKSLLTSAVMGYILCRLNDCESSSSLLLSRGRLEFETGLFIQCVMLR